MKRAQPLFLVLVIALWLPCWILFLSLAGCESGTSGLFRPVAPGVEHTITNTVTTVQAVAPGVIPQPWSTAVEAGGAAVLALLAAWQGLTHSKVAKLESPQPKV